MVKNGGESKMAKEVKPIDITTEPVLLRLAEEVLTSGEPRVLRREDEDLVMVTPVRRARSRRSKRTPSKADYEAFLSSAGSWSDVDTEKLVADVYESRRRSTRPPVEL